ncbi:ABC transporter ATP-binding protein [Reichenbachiella agarivorans]|uniref:ABC transporter ATP-binding protein n=1 Tax=Reichenbachiella agarivorans TaxID=2979464 RepID=A0ABY6CPU5_9BACT|nr:ABC transporter ATP-binding protein [Reichenbachiella agarivorans]UXP32542.1 ABC transporter ATP-binding protein [Reichenbachiella agarivorans]
MLAISHIEIADLYKRYPKASGDSLSNINLRIDSGTKYGLLGPNGAGKTTLISILCGFLEASKGSLKYYSTTGEEIIGRDRKSIIGFVPQEYAMYDEMTPLQNLAYFGALYNMKPVRIKQRSEELLAVLGLSEVAHKRVRDFSGGMKRRVNLAIGIIHDPVILFLDEPTVGVDVQSKHAIIRFLNELNEQGTTIIYTSHHMNEAQEFCQELMLIDHGTIVAQGKTEELMKDHQADDLHSLFISLTGEEYRN